MNLYKVKAKVAHNLVVFHVGAESYGEAQGLADKACMMLLMEHNDKVQAHNAQLEDQGVPEPIKMGPFSFWAAGQVKLTPAKEWKVESIKLITDQLILASVEIEVGDAEGR